MSNPTLLSILFLILTLSSLLPTSLPCPTCPTPRIRPPPPPPRNQNPCPPPPKPKPKPKPSSHCPIDILKLDACVDVLGGLVNIVIGGEAKQECCPVIAGLADLDAALCLCTTIRAKLLDINILLPIALELLVDCGKHAPADYQCPA